MGSSQMRIGRPQLGFPQYQGGASFTVFSAQGSNPIVNCKISGKTVQKVYDKSVKGYVYSCNGGMSSKLQLPKDDRKSGLQLVQPYLVLQIFLQEGHHFSFELRVTDTTNTKRKMYFSTSFSELKTTPLHCQIPISMVMQNTWLTLAIHVADLFDKCFRVMSFRSIDVIIIGPVCKLRKIFTMKNRLAETAAYALSNEDWLPPEHLFASSVNSSIQFLNFQKLQDSLSGNISVNDKLEGDPDANLSSRAGSNKGEKQVHLAFGSRIPLPLCMVQLNVNIPEDSIHNPPKRWQKPPSLPSSLNQIGLKKNPKTREIPTISVDSCANNITNRKTEEPYNFPTVDSFGSCERAKEEEEMSESHFINEIINRSINMNDSTTFTVQEEASLASVSEVDPDRKLKCFPIKKPVSKILKRQGKVREEKQQKNTGSKVGKIEQLSDSEFTPRSPPCGWDRGSGSSVGFDSMPLGHFSESLPFSGDITDIVDNDDLICITSNSFNRDNDDDYRMSDNGGLQRGSFNDIDGENKVEDAYFLDNYSEHQSWNSVDSSPDGIADPHNYSSQQNPVLSQTPDQLSSRCRTKTEILAEEPNFELDDTNAAEELWVVHEENDIDNSGPARNCNLLGVQLSAPDFPQEEIRVSSFITDEKMLCKDQDSTLHRNSHENIWKQKSSAMQRSNSLIEQIPALNLSIPSPKSDTLCVGDPAGSKCSGRELDLLYDPILDCYYDPKTNRYYELK